MTPCSRLAFLCGVAIAASGVLSSPALEYFVAPSGDNRSGGGSAARPFATIPAALARAKPGDRVVLRQGEYRLAETLRFPRGGEAGRPITLAAHEDEYVALLGSVRLTGWERHKARIWRCQAPPRPVKGLYEDSERLVHPRARAKRENPPVSAIQAPGRWTQQDGWIYLWTREGDSPDNHRIEASQHGVVNLNRPWLRVERLRVFFGQPTGLVISADHCEAVDCEVAHVSNSVDNAYGAYISGCSNSALRRLRVHDSYYWGDHGSNSHVVSCIDCGDSGPNFVADCEIFNGGLGVGTKGAAREMVVSGCYIHDVLSGVVISGQRSAGPGAGKTDRGHYLIWRNRIHDAARGVYFSSGDTSGNRVVGNLFERCESGVYMRKVKGIAKDTLVANNVFAHCGAAIQAIAERQGKQTLAQYAAAGLKSRHNLFHANQADWRNPLTWSRNLDKTFAEIGGFENLGWEKGSIGGDPLLDEWGRSGKASPTIGAGTRLELPTYVERPAEWHIGLGPWGQGRRRLEPGLTLSIAGSQSTIGAGETVRLRAVLRNESLDGPAPLTGDCLVTFHFRYANVWYFDRQEIWRVRVRLPARRLAPGESLDLSSLEGWSDPTNGPLGSPFHLRADDHYWMSGCRLRATARFIQKDESTTKALRRLTPLLRSIESTKVAFR